MGLGFPSPAHPMLIPQTHVKSGDSTHIVLFAVQLAHQRPILSYPKPLKQNMELLFLVDSTKMRLFKSLCKMRTSNNGVHLMSVILGRDEGREFGDF